MRLLSENDKLRMGVLPENPALPDGVTTWALGPGYVEKAVLEIQEDADANVPEKLRRFANLCSLVAETIDGGSCFMPDECVENLGVFSVRP